MKNEFKDIEQLERYQRGTCSGKEKNEIEHRLAKDENFRGLHDDMELMVQGLRRTSEGSSIEDKIELLRGAFEIEDETKETEVINLNSWFSRNRSKLSIAATISLLVASIFIFKTSTTNPDNLFQNYFEPYENLNSALRDSQQEIDDLALAYLAYEQEQYEKAARLFESANAKNTELITHLFYQGNAYLAIGEAEKAIALFQIVSESNSILQDTAKWYLALSYLKAKDLEKCKELLDKISIANNGFSKRADDILQQLK
ncbi:MAG: hypothetical protein ABJP45_18990 [Cyclobacteriaceae bacterium]